MGDRETGAVRPAAPPLFEAGDATHTHGHIGDRERRRRRRSHARVPDAPALGRWARLFALALLVGGAGASLSANVLPVSPTLDPTYSGPTPADAPAGDVETPLESVTAEQLLVAAAAVAGAFVALGLLFALAQALAEFAFVESLRSGEVAIRLAVRRHRRRGLGLFAFRLTLGVTALALFAPLVAAAAVQVPIQAYLRYYGLLVLGDIDLALDLVDERRRRVRERRLGAVAERDAEGDAAER